MWQDISSVAIWWFTLFLIGLVFLPLTNKLFGNFFDKGYLFSKVIGLALSSYFVWNLSSQHLIRFSQSNILITLIILTALINFLLPLNFKKIFLQNKKIFIAEELIFLITLTLWSYVRALQPDIYGLEKYMDFGFVNSIMRADYLPPQDMWYAGKTINYYYYGHYVAAFLTKLSNIPASVTYNLIIASLFALTFTLTFSLTANLIHFSKGNKKRAILGGSISALLISIGGNLHTVIYSFILPIAAKIGLYHDSLSSYWYPNATRFIGYFPPTNDKTIHEFPSYSFIVSDLHAHVSDIPFVLTFIALLLAYFSSSNTQLTNQKPLPTIKQITLSILPAVFLAIFFMTNTWDYPIYAVLLGIVLFIKRLSIQPSWLSVLYSFRDWLIILLLSGLLIVPFQANFQNFSQGVGIVSHHSTIYQFFVLWGYQLIFSVLFLIYLVKKWRNKLQPNYFPLMFISAMILLSIILLITPEFIYVRDIYENGYQRANTMFKLTYEAFIMFSIAIGFIVITFIQNTSGKIKSYGLKTLFTILVVAPLVYFPYSLAGYYTLENKMPYEGLDGVKFIQQKDPEDWAIIDWLNKNIKGQPAILEANGDSYSDYGRISAMTGLPTIQGWYVHEWLWRGNSQAPQLRGQEVSTVYTSTDINETKQILQKYQVHYIVISDLERQKYPDIQEEKLKSLGLITWQKNNALIIQIPN